jgi:CRISPR-associated endonuclease/helicase Cas3
MAQRFGRVNRFGRREDTEIDVVYPTRFAQGDDRDSRREKTLGLLRQLEDDASPDALGRLLSRIDREARLAAFSKEPLVPLTSDILFDSWAMTTVRGDLPGRPPVEPYLHGLSEDELPRTKVAWRNDVRYITRPLLNRYPPANLLADYPLKPHEILEDYSYRVFKHLMTLAQRHPDEPAWLVGVKGDVEVLDLKTLADKDRKDRINGRTVLLPPTVGGLSADGLLDGKSVEADDVADDWKDKVGEPRNRRRRERQPGLAPPEEMRLIRTIDLDPEADAGESEGAEDSEVGEEAKPARYWNWYARPDSADDDGSRSSKWAVAGDIHTEDVARLTERIVCALKLPDELGRSLVVAARLHDEGKKRVPWQKSIGNPKPTSWLAKSGKTKSGQWIKPVEIGLTYRHEFGSLLDAEEAPEFRALSDEQKDLVLHLIAAHHGHGRPHFDSDRAFDPERSREDADAMAAAVPRRFARLQRKYGRWGLAYLESILRAADWAASAEPSVVVESLP